MLSHVRLFATPWTRAHQAPLSIGFPKQEYWSWLPFPFSGDLPNSRIKSVSPAWQILYHLATWEASEVLGVRHMYTGKQKKFIIPRLIKSNSFSIRTSQGALVVRNLLANAGDTGLIPVSGRSPGGGNGNPLQYSCLENPTDRGA